jgi:hypothetical protein
MYAALDTPRTARAELVAATQQGRSSRAIQLMNQAIDETNAGIRCVEQFEIRQARPSHALACSFCLRKTRTDTI